MSRVPWRNSIRFSSSRLAMKDVVILQLSAGTIPNVLAYRCSEGEPMNFQCVLLMGTTVLLSGCVMEHAGPAKNEFQVFERDDSEVVRVSLNMGAGELRVGSGT